MPSRARTTLSARYRRTPMTSEGPLRSRPGDAASTGWRVVHAKGTTTELRRPRLVSGRGLLLVFPIIFAIACAGWLFGAPFVMPLGALCLLVAMLWPLPEERLSVTARHVRWKDRALGSRFRASLDDTRLVTRSAGAERALLLTDGRTEQLLAMAAPEDVDALVELLHDALSRARQESARGPGHSE